MTEDAQKSSVEEIRRRFDRDVERFSNLETGQSATMDAPLVMTLLAQAAVAATPRIRRVLDLGCGAGNHALLLGTLARGFALDLADLSLPMLERARDRCAAAGIAPVRTHPGDIRTVALEDGAYDVILEAAVLHHLRDDADWERMFARLYRLCAPGGRVWISDLVAQEIPGVQALMRRRYGEYLCGVGGAEYRDQVLANIEREDSPRPLSYQLALLQRVGFTQVEVLHKNGCFAAFGAVRSDRPAGAGA